MQDTPAKTLEVTLESLWQRFNTEFPTEEDCLEELYTRAAEEGLLKCRSCGSEHLDRTHGSRTARCRRCAKETWLTAGTFFHRIRQARPWLAAIWLMEHGVSLNSARFQRLVQIAYSSALAIFRKVSMVLDGQMGDGAPSLPSSLFSLLMCKRSRQTPSKAHPIAEQEEIERNHCAPAAASELSEEAELSEQEQTVCAALSSEPVHVDDLCRRLDVDVSKLAASLIMLELAGAATRMPGDRYVRSSAIRGADVVGTTAQDSRAASAGDTMTTAVDAIIAFVREAFHGVSRKYLQNYIAAHWCILDRARWHSRALLHACLRRGYISRTEIRAYVTPIMVKVSASR